MLAPPPAARRGPGQQPQGRLAAAGPVLPLLLQLWSEGAPAGRGQQLAPPRPCKCQLSDRSACQTTAGVRHVRAARLPVIRAAREHPGTGRHIVKWRVKPPACTGMSQWLAQDYSLGEEHGSNYVSGRQEVRCLGSGSPACSDISPTLGAPGGRRHARAQPMRAQRRPTGHPWQ
jgi:hypothetical protein